MKPIVDGLEQDFGSTVQVVRLDFEGDANSKLMDALGVRAHPTFVIFNGAGEPGGPIVGQVPAERLRLAIVAVLPP